MDDDEVGAAAAEELQSDQADDDYHHSFNSPPLHPEEEEGDFPMAEDGEDVSGSNTASADDAPRPPTFIRYSHLQMPSRWYISLSLFLSLKCLSRILR